jgi:hypothetical protein
MKLLPLIASSIGLFGISAIASPSMAATLGGDLSDSEMLSDLSGGETFDFLDEAFARQTAFPAGAKIIDVTQPPYNAAGDGVTDDTAAIQKALSDFPNGNRIIYLPEGTYLISDRLDWPAGIAGATDYKRTILQGESTDGVTIKLSDNAQGYDDPENPKGMIYTGPDPAQRFRNAVRNLTIDTGTGNAGAIGLQFNASNQGTVREVRIRSGDGQGRYGLDLGFVDEIGPLLVKNVEVDGFDIGIRTGFTVNSMTFEDIWLHDQNEYGLVNGNQVVNLRGLRSENQVPVIYNQNGRGLVTLVDSMLVGGDPTQAAIANEATLFARNVTTSGYLHAIDNRDGHDRDVLEAMVDEFVSHDILSLHPTPQRSLNLPVKETPEPPPDPVENWVSIEDFGAIADDDLDDSAAIQAAIDSGAKTVYVPPGEFIVNETVFVRGNVQHLLGTEGWILGGGQFEVVDGTAPTVTIERFARLAGGVFHNTSRSLVLRHLILFQGRYESLPKGSGDLYLEDVAGQPWTFNHQNVWARQLNPESDEVPKIVNNGSNLWILGLKTERANSIIITRNGGKTEVLGAHIYSTGDEKTRPMFVNDNSSVSLAGIRETNFNNNPFPIAVEETRNGDTRRLTPDEAASGVNGSALPLYVGYPTEVNPESRQSIPEPSAILGLLALAGFGASGLRRRG